MRAIVVLALLSILSVTQVSAAVMVGQPPSGSTSFATGFFGGIKKGDTFMMNLSEQGGIRYYRVSPSFTVFLNGVRIRLDRLPLATPVKVTTEKGQVVDVEILRGER